MILILSNPKGKCKHKLKYRYQSPGLKHKQMSALRVRYKNGSKINTESNYGSVNKSMDVSSVKHLRCKTNTIKLREGRSKQFNTQIFRKLNFEWKQKNNKR